MPTVDELLGPSAPASPPKGGGLPAADALLGGTSEKVYYNDAGQPFTLSGKPPSPAPAQDQGYTGSILPLSRDASGLHLATPETIASPVRGAISGGQRALGVGEAGQNPLRPLSPDELAAVAAFGQVPFRVGETPAAPTLPASGISRERAMLAHEATTSFDIPITAAQLGMSKTAQMAESAVKSLPLSGAREFEMRQRQAFNRALSKTFGQDAPAVTQSVMDAAKKDLGGTINRIEDSAQVRLDDPFMRRMGEIEASTQSSVTPAEFSVIEKQLAGVLHNLQPDGTIRGETYGNLLGRNSPLDRAIGNNNSNISRPAQQIKEALQDALQRSLSGDDLAAYQKARLQYKNMKTVEPLVNKAPEGNISPALLNERVTKQFPNRAYDTSGTNQLDRLAKIGQAFLKEPGTSGTSERGWTLARLGELGAAVAAGDIFGIPVAIGGTAATLGSGRLIGAMMRSPRITQRSIRKALTPPPPGSEPRLWSSYPYRAVPGVAFGGQQNLDDTLGHMPP